MIKLRENLKILSKYPLQISTVIFSFLFVLNYLIRFIKYNNFSQAGEQFYHYLRLASLNPFVVDSLSVIKEKFYDPFVIIYYPIRYVIEILEFPVLILLVQYFLGIITIYLFFKILDKEINNKLYVFLASFIFSISTFLIHSFVIFNPLLIFTFLLVLVAYLYVMNHKIQSILIFILISLLGLHYFITSMVLLTFLIINYNDYKNIYDSKKTVSIPYFLIPYIFGIMFYTVLIYLGYIPAKDLTLKLVPLKSFISDLGSISGYGLFYFLLSLIGAVMLWKKRHWYWHIYMSFAFLVIYVLFFSVPRILLHFVMVLFTVYAISIIINRSWRLELIQKLTLFILLLGLMFSCLSYIDRVSVTEPTPETIKAYGVINTIDFSANNDINNLENIEINNSIPQQSSIFINPNMAEITKYYTNKTVLFSSFETYNEDEFNSILNSRNLRLTTRLLEENNVKIIVITENDKNLYGQEIGLKFLLDNSKTFKSIYQSSEIEIWKVSE